MVRESSGASTATRASASARWLPNPVMSQSTSYNGTSAKPNAKLPSAKPSSFTVSRLFAPCVWSVIESGPAHRHHDEGDVETERDETQQDGGFARLRAPLADFLGSHRGGSG